jgi:hypothetical protein
MLAPACPTCHALHHLLLEAEPDVVRRGVDARARGPGWGVLIALPEELGAETAEEAAELEAARERGYYVGVAPITALAQMVSEHDHHPEAVAGILRQLSRPAPEGQVHVLGVLDGCVAAVTARADPALAAARDIEAFAARRRAELMALAEPAVLRWAGETPQRAGSVFVVSAPDDPIVGRLHRGSEVALAAARADGAYVRLHNVADAIAALPLEHLDAGDALRVTQRLTAALPAGAIRAVLLHEGHVLVITQPAAPGCLGLE